jgi:hypothetical protein
MWVRVLDLPMDKMNRVYGKLIGNWVGKFIKVEVDEDGFAWGKHLRIRVSVRIDQPLLRGVFLQDSEEEEGMWFDLKYEKIPHFCFDCGCLVHSDGECKGEKKEVAQWGECLRASPMRSQKPPPATRPSMSSGSFSCRSASSDTRGWSTASVCDVPPRRNLANDFAYYGSSRTGGGEGRRNDAEVYSPEKRHRAPEEGQVRDRVPEVPPKGKAKVGTFTRRPRKASTAPAADLPSAPLGAGNKKRGTKQVWMPISVQVVGEGSDESAGKRQRTTVFDRIADPTTNQEGQSSSVFDRLQYPSADPAGRGRREQ